jgi:uncharacterized protein (TIGR02646 family)
MIRVQKSATPPEGFAEKAAAETKHLHALYNGGQRAFGEEDFKASIYQSVKAKLSEQHHGKCCYCETKTRENSHYKGDVEHYRPKAKSTQSRSDTHQNEGYYWLAYDWDNLLYACETCNRKYKRTLFPLAKPEHRAKSHNDDIAHEEPLLLHPAHDDPKEHIGFDIDSLIPQGITPKGAETLKICGLDNIHLAEDRRNALAFFRLMIDAAQVEMPESASIREKLRVNKDRICSPKEEYSSLVRTLWETHLSTIL